MAGRMNVVVLGDVFEVVEKSLISAGLVVQMSRVVPIVVSLRAISASVRTAICATPIVPSTVVSMRIANIGMHATGLEVEALGVCLLSKRSPSC